MRYSVRTPDGRPLYRSGDIVPINVPYDDQLSALGPKSRPCLVLDQQDRRICMAYGTDEVRDYNADPDDIVLLDFEWKKYGLRKPTRFCIKRVIDFPVNKKWLNFKYDKPFGTLPTDLFSQFYVKLTRRIFHRQQQVPHVVYRGGASAPTGTSGSGATSMRW